MEILRRYLRVMQRSASKSMHKSELVVTSMKDNEILDRASKMFGVPATCRECQQRISRIRASQTEIDEALRYLWRESHQ